MARQLAAQTTFVGADGPLRVRYERLRLRVIRGPDAGATVAMATDDLGIGSHPSNQLVLTDALPGQCPLQHPAPRCPAQPELPDDGIRQATAAQIGDPILPGG